jgi:hypothetical protein
MLPHDRSTVLRGKVDKALTDMRGGQTLEEGLVGGRKAVVGFISRCPEGIASYGGQFSDLKTCVIGRNVLESNVRVLVVSLS